MSRTHTLVVIRSNRVVEQYAFSGTNKQAKAEAKRLACDVHIGATISVESVSGIVVGVSK